MGIIRGEYAYVPEEGVGEGVGREGAGEGADREGAGEKVKTKKMFHHYKEDVSSFLNPSSDGMEIEMFDEGQTNIMMNGNCKQTSMARYLYLAFRDMMGICIHVLTTLSFFSPLDQANRLLNEAQAKS
jgi:hypothetical protein